MKRILIFLMTVFVIGVSEAEDLCMEPVGDIEILRCGMEGIKSKLYIHYSKELKDNPGLTGEIIFDVSVSSEGVLSNMLHSTQHTAHSTQHTAHSTQHTAHRKN